MQEMPGDKTITEIFSELIKTLLSAKPRLKIGKLQTKAAIMMEYTMLPHNQELDQQHFLMLTTIKCSLCQLPKDILELPIQVFSIQMMTWSKCLEINWHPEEPEVF